MVLAADAQLRLDASWLDSQMRKADGLHINLWAGIGMLVVGGLFVAWAQWLPIVVPTEPGKAETDRPQAP